MGSIESSSSSHDSDSGLGCSHYEYDLRSSPVRPKVSRAGSHSIAIDSTRLDTLSRASGALEQLDGRDGMDGFKSRGAGKKKKKKTRQPSIDDSLSRKEKT